MESPESQEREDGIRLRKKIQENEEDLESSECEDDAKRDLVKRILESTKELTDCMPTDLPSAKRMLEDGLHAAAEFSSDMAAGAGAVAEQAGEICRKVIEASWKVCHFQALPHWLQDNDYLIWGHRPPLPSFTACFQSLFRIHTETGNIWTHLIGCVLFVSLAVYTLIWSDLQMEERLVFAAFFAGAILCLGLSCTYHTVHCHSEFVGKLFSKLDYVGISFLILGSLVPWLYYTFYCQYQPKVIYLTVATVLGLGAIITSMVDRFGEPKYRPFRAGIFIAFGLSGAIPAIHYAVMEGWVNAVSYASLGWLILMGSLYILGALLYAGRIPECYFPGKCDIWFQSHQIFHVLVIAAAFVHYQGISEMAVYRLTNNQCPASVEANHA
ncbi:adiponectin receptor protein-like [Daphnia carinata]|uniref:adiponectin receptor protein-like n=1 Tax=Daphnia carinata TaxID=120202 RepID=UPI00257FB4A0|nr:adiponectin receptor protein-like [Daphnia carinata]